LRRRSWVGVLRGLTMGMEVEVGVGVAMGRRRERRGLSCLDS
jgi:hypothetical protein